MKTCNWAQFKRWLPTVYVTMIPAENDRNYGGQSRRDTCDLNSPFLSIVRKNSNRGTPAADVASCLEKYGDTINTEGTQGNSKTA